MKVPRRCVGGMVYHVLNRANGKLSIFKKRGDFEAFDYVLAEALGRCPCELLAYCVMRNHWHLLLRPREDGALTEMMHWLTVTHVRRWHTAHGTVGIGHVYQGRFKSFPVASEAYYLTVVRYIESNPVRAGLVARAQEWEWSSLSLRDGAERSGLKLATGPVELPRNWGRLVNVLPRRTELSQLENAVRRGCPFGPEDWVQKTAGRLGLEGTLRARGRPSGSTKEGSVVRGTEVKERRKGGRPKTSTKKESRSL